MFVVVQLIQIVVIVYHIENNVIQIHQDIQLLTEYYVNEHELLLMSAIQIMFSVPDPDKSEPDIQKTDPSSKIIIF